MNLASAKLLNDSLQNLADNFYRERALEQTGKLEAQRLAVEQAFRDAMMQHYADIEQRQADTADKQAGMMDKQVAQGTMAQKQDLLKTVMGLNATGQLTDSGRDAVNKWLATDPDLGKTGMQLQASPSPSTDPSHQQSALVQAVGMYQQLLTQAANTSDPAQAAIYSRVADALADNLPAAVKSIPGNRYQGRARQQAGMDDPASPTADSSGDGVSSSAATPAGVPAVGGPVTLTPQDLTPATRYPAPPASHINFLQANPGFAPQFDAKYGPGASSQYLTPQPQASGD